jgi:hypothetical protein
MARGADPAAPDGLDHDALGCVVLERARRYLSQRTAAATRTSTSVDEAIGAHGEANATRSRLDSLGLFGSKYTVTCAPTG